MKKLILAVLLIAIASFYGFKDKELVTVSEKTTPQIFFVDKKLHRLVSLDFPQNGDKEYLCRKLVDALLFGKDENREILRLLPKEKGAISVTVKDDFARVNLSEKLIPKISKNPENERLVIYQIVNSLTTVDGISFVTFTIDGKSRKDFLGFLDMREIFTPNYDI